MIILIALAVLAAAVAAAVWIVSGREPILSTSDERDAWFVALKFRPGDAARVEPLAQGVRVKWSGDAAVGVIGGPAYWDRFLLLAGGDLNGSPLTPDAAVEDAQVIQVRLGMPPRWVLGALRLLWLTGITRMPRHDVRLDMLRLSSRPDIMPTPASAQELLSQPQSFRPVMMNFLRYHAEAHYTPAPSDGQGSGRAAYGRYGTVAVQTVYRTGGQLMFMARARRVVREPKAGPTVGAWNDIGAMAYSEPKSMLSMEQVPRYAAALRHRDAGLAATVLVACRETGRAGT